MRKCQKCKELKLLNEFFYRTKKRLLRSSYCKNCFQDINVAYKKKNPEKIKVIKCKEYAKNKRKYLEAHYIKRYGIDHDQYDEMCAKQNNLCVICQIPHLKKLVIDHCHSTGKVRDLLCTNCNRMVGDSKENINTLLNAIEYIKKHQY